MTDAQELQAAVERLRGDLGVFTPELDADISTVLTGLADTQAALRQLATAAGNYLDVNGGNEEDSLRAALALPAVQAVL